MVIKRRKLKIKPKKLTSDRALTRMSAIATHFDKQEFAETYINSFHRNMLARLQSIAAKAEEARNWKFMDGCFKQATELYVLASVLYEKFPDHVILTDGAYDALSKWLLKNRKHMDKDFLLWYNVTAMGLKAGTGYNVQAREPIPQYVYILTGERIEETDGKSSQDKPSKLRGNVKRRSKPTPRRSGSPPRRRIRSGKRGRKPDQKS